MTISFYDDDSKSAVFGLSSSQLLLSVIANKYILRITRESVNISQNPNYSV